MEIICIACKRPIAVGQLRRKVWGKTPAWQHTWGWVHGSRVDSCHNEEEIS